jgi:hypothetical protein
MVRIFADLYVEYSTTSSYHWPASSVRSQHSFTFFSLFGTLKDSRCCYWTEDLCAAFNSLTFPSCFGQSLPTMRLASLDTRSTVGIYPGAAANHKAYLTSASKACMLGAFAARCWLAFSSVILVHDDDWLGCLPLKSAS